MPVLSDNIYSIYPSWSFKLTVLTLVIKFSLLKTLLYSYRVLYSILVNEMVTTKDKGIRVFSIYRYDIKH